MTEEMQVARRTLVSTLTGYACKRSINEIVGFPFEFACDNGDGIAGTVKLVDAGPERHLRLIFEGTFLIEWRWVPENAANPGYWDRPRLFCHYFGSRPGVFTLQPPALVYRN